jgi:hypothetical protein
MLIESVLQIQGRKSSTRPKANVPGSNLSNDKYDSVRPAKVRRQTAQSFAHHITNNEWLKT